MMGKNAVPGLLVLTRISGNAVLLLRLKGDKLVKSPFAEKLFASAIGISAWEF